jgi:hypothetical protein
VVIGARGSGSQQGKLRRLSIAQSLSSISNFVEFSILLR